jgi:4-aminobutyrate aminotransferase-like enzyme
MKGGLEEMAATRPSMTNVRGQGLLLALDLPDGETRARVRQACWDRGLAVLAAGPRSLRFRPPLVFSEEEAERALHTLGEALDAVA